jgi:hypothetical protein
LILSDTRSVNAASSVTEAFTVLSIDAVQELVVADELVQIEVSDLSKAVNCKGLMIISEAIPDVPIAVPTVFG